MNFSLDYTLPVSVSVILDILVIGIAVFCAWKGWRKGIIGGLCSILAILVSFYGANLIASTYSAEFTGIIEPFAHGIVDTMVNKVTGAAQETDEDVPAAEDAEEGEEEERVERAVVVVLSEEEKQDVYSVAFAVLRQVGFHEDTAANIAQGAVEVADYVDSDLSEFLSEQLCSVAAFIGVFIIAFILISIIFIVIENVLDLVFNLPGIELVNHIFGLCLGLALAICVLQFIAYITRFTGIVISDETISSTMLFKYFVENNYLAEFLGV